MIFFSVGDPGGKIPQGVAKKPGLRYHTYRFMQQNAKS